MKVVVVGAGIVGVSIAVELAKRGAEVTIAERDSPGSGTSSTSFAWVNSNNKEPSSYYELNLAGLEAHAKLAATGASWLQTTGHIEFATQLPHVNDLRERTHRLRERGYEVESISADRVRELASDVIIPDDCHSAVFYPRESHCFPSLYIDNMLDQAALLGVSLRRNGEVRELAPVGRGARVTFSDGSSMFADYVISAAGRWTNQIAELAGVPPVMAEYERPGDVTVGYLATTNPLPVTLDRIITSPRLNIRPAGDGRLLLQALDLDVQADPFDVPATDSVTAQEFISRLNYVVKNTDRAVISSLKVGQRAMPSDGHSVIGASAMAPWLYLVATHSGVTLAPMLGTAVAGEIFGEPEPLFVDFRPDRFFGQGELPKPHVPRRPGEQ